GWPRAMVSFEEFVNDGKKRLRKCQAERRRRLGIDGKLELGRLLDRHVARFCAAENFVHHFGGLSEQIGVVRSIRHQTTCCDIVVRRSSISIDFRAYCLWKDRLRRGSRRWETCAMQRVSFGTSGSQVQILPLRPAFSREKSSRGTIWGTKLE